MNVTLGQLRSVSGDADVNWILAEGVTIAPSSDQAPVTGQQAFVLTSTADNGRHRIGLERNFGPGKRTYHIVVWVKPAGDVDAMLEACGKALDGTAKVENYGVGYFDLKADKVSDKLMADKVRATNLAVAQDGAWTKLSADLTTEHGWVVLVIGMVSKGSNSFAGNPALKLTVGGVKIEPAS